jgi:hypothetical protein
LLPAGAELVDLGRVRLFRYLPLQAFYPPDAPFSGGRGRFDAGRATLYLAATAEGAAAEFYRRNPEFLADQAAVERFHLFAVDLDVRGPVLDVRSPGQATAAGIAFDRLTSNESDAEVRYRECRDLAANCGQGTTGILYPSSALRTGSWNLVVFDEAGHLRWLAASAQRVPVPLVDPSGVVILQQHIPETPRGRGRAAR